MLFHTLPQNHVFGVPYQLSSDLHDEHNVCGEDDEQLHHSYAKMKIPQLKEELKKHKLRLGGRKKELIDRLLKHHAETARAQKLSNPVKKFYNCPSDAVASEVRIGVIGKQHQWRYHLTRNDLYLTSQLCLRRRLI